MKDEINAFTSSFILSPYPFILLPNLHLNVFGADTRIAGLAAERLEELGHVRDWAHDAETRRRVRVCGEQQP
jgi:hypothetical protein